MNSDIEKEIENCDLLWTDEHETEVINSLQARSNSGDVPKSRQYYYYRANFKIVNFAGVSKVARIKDGRIMATKPNVFTIIKDLHTACGHKGEKKTYKKISEHYANIPMTVIKSFISQCERCAEKSKKSNSAGIVVRPITVKELNQRGQVDLVDFQSLPDGEFKFILNYQEHLTKFRFLLPLKSKTAIEVANALLKIFLQFGAPHVLQSDNGREFTAGIIKELGSLWADLVLVNGRPRHPQSQGSVERSNASLKESIVAWMRDNKTSSWSVGLPFVQWALNTTYHEAIKMQPYEAVFGHKARMGLKSKIPREFLEKITNGIFEEDMIMALQENQGQPSAEPEPRTETTLEMVNIVEEGNQTEIISGSVEHGTEYFVMDVVDDSSLNLDDVNVVVASFGLLENTQEPGKNPEQSVEDETTSPTSVEMDFPDSNKVDEEEHPVKRFRAMAARHLLDQAEKMVNRSNKKLGVLNKGDNVLVTVSEFDRGRGDPPNLIGVVIQEKEGKYKIGTKHGIIQNWLERNSLATTKYAKLSVNDVPLSKETSVRELVRLGSVGTGQGYKRCTCKKDCKSARCKCFKNGFVCNSACHFGKTCLNHD